MNQVTPEGTSARAREAFQEYITIRIPDQDRDIDFPYGVMSAVAMCIDLAQKHHPGSVVELWRGSRTGDKAYLWDTFESGAMEREYFERLEKAEERGDKFILSLEEERQRALANEKVDK